MSPSSINIYEDLPIHTLVEHALQNKEGILSQRGGLSVTTGKRTGRSRADRFIVKDQDTATHVDWGTINQPIAPAQADALWRRAEDYIGQRDHYISHLRVGADREYGLAVKVMTETAWHNLFAKHLFIDTDVAEKMLPHWTVLSVPGLATDPKKDGVNSDGAVIIDFSQQRVLLAGMLYAGEMKKAMFSVLNYLLPKKNVLPMHCAANMGIDDDVVLFFGLSGTGKTTLSADPDRFLIGDDEHGWSERGIFNFEGGCYAKCIDLSQDKEPVIWDAIRDGAIMENVVLDDEGIPDYKDATLTQNTRAAYPREYIAKRVHANAAGQPHALIFLTCDLYGVLPPVAKLTKAQAAYYFLSGYTALVGGTEVGLAKAVQSTFSTCFGAPFFPRMPTVYADLLWQRIELTGCSVYLVNTGWTGGSYENGGERFPIKVTRRIIQAIVADELKDQCVVSVPGFRFCIPKTCSGISSAMLNPQETWSSKAAYHQQAQLLIQEFQANFEKFNVSDAIKTAGPVLFEDR